MTPLPNPNVTKHHPDSHETFIVEREKTVKERNMVTIRRRSRLLYFSLEKEILKINIFIHYFRLRNSHSVSFHEVSLLVRKITIILFSLIMRSCLVATATQPLEHNDAPLLPPSGNLVFLQSNFILSPSFAFDSEVIFITSDFK